MCWDNFNKPKGWGNFVYGVLSCCTVLGLQITSCQTAYPLCKCHLQVDASHQRMSQPIGNMSGTSILNRRWLLGLEANFGLRKTDWTDLNKPHHWPNFNQCAASRRLQEWGSADIFATYGVRPVEPYLYLAAILLPHWIDPQDWETAMVWYFRMITWRKK